MKKYGIDNVRGGNYSGLYLSKETISFLEKEIYHSDNLCFNCKTHGHYSNQCHLKKKTKVIPYTENNITENKNSL